MRGWHGCRAAGDAAHCKCPWRRMGLARACKTAAAAWGAARVRRAARERGWLGAARRRRREEGGGCGSRAPLACPPPHLGSVDRVGV
eukprot:6491293-Prymnesium_polylepis.1